MKASEAPEKIYIHPDIGGREFLRPWLHRPANNESVEYIRTDAFIEKACEYLYQYNRNIVKKHGAKAVLGCSEFTVSVEGFKKYMEGE